MQQAGGGLRIRMNHVVHLPAAEPVAKPVAEPVVVAAVEPEQPRNTRNKLVAFKKAPLNEQIMRFDPNDKPPPGVTKMDSGHQELLASFSPEQLFMFMGTQYSLAEMQKGWNAFSKLGQEAHRRTQRMRFARALEDDREVIRPGPVERVDRQCNRVTGLSKIPVGYIPLGGFVHRWINSIYYVVEKEDDVVSDSESETEAKTSSFKLSDEVWLPEGTFPITDFVEQLDGTFKLVRKKQKDVRGNPIPLKQVRAKKFMPFTNSDGVDTLRPTPMRRPSMTRKELAELIEPLKTGKIDGKDTYYTFLNPLFEQQPEGISVWIGPVRKDHESNYHFVMFGDDVEDTQHLFVCVVHSSVKSSLSSIRWEEGTIDRVLLQETSEYLSESDIAPFFLGSAPEALRHFDQLACKRLSVNGKSLHVYAMEKFFDKQIQARKKNHEDYVWKSQDEEYYDVNEKGIKTVYKTARQALMFSNGDVRKDRNGNVMYGERKLTDVLTDSKVYSNHSVHVLPFFHALPLCLRDHFRPIRGER